MTVSTRMRAAGIAAGCAGVGAIAGIAGAAAAPATHPHAARTQKANQSTAADPRFGGHGRPGAGGPAVHADEVVLNKAGTAFITATEDNGTFQSSTGDQLTIDEKIGTVDYKTVTLTIPSGATVVRNDATVPLSALKSGDHVRVSQSSDGTTVVADDGTHREGPGGGFGGPGGGHWGPGDHMGAPPLPQSGSGTSTTGTTTTG